MFVQKVENWPIMRNDYNLSVVVSADDFVVGHFIVTIIVDDVIDETPVFTKSLYEINLPRKRLNGTRINDFVIFDKDLRDKHILKILSVKPAINIFGINQGLMSLYTNSDVEFVDNSYNIVIQVTDLAGLSSITTVLLKIQTLSNYQHTRHSLH